MYFNHIDFLKVLERLLLEENCDLYNLYYGRYSKFNETGRTIVSYNLETREGWKFYRIDQTKFIFCLVKGSFYQFCCQSDENILLNDGNNIYYKVVVPIVLDL